MTVYNKTISTALKGSPPTESLDPSATEGLRITESGDIRVLEDGTPRITEGSVSREMIKQINKSHTTSLLTSPLLSKPLVTKGLSINTQSWAALKKGLTRTASIAMLQMAAALLNSTLMNPIAGQSGTFVPPLSVTSLLNRFAATLGTGSVPVRNLTKSLAQSVPMSQLLTASFAFFRTLAATVNTAYQNIIRYSSDFTNWGTYGGAGQATGQVGPDGISTNATLANNTSNVNSYLIPVSSATIENNAVYVYGFKAKFVSGTGIIIPQPEMGTGGPALYATAYFNTLTGVAGKGSSLWATMDPLPDGWYYCKAAFLTAPAGTARFRVVYIGGYGQTPTPTSVLMAEFQMNAGEELHPYIDNPGTTTAYSSASVVARAIAAARLAVTNASGSIKRDNTKTITPATIEVGGVVTPYRRLNRSLVPASVLNGSSMKTIAGRILAAQVGQLYVNKVRNQWAVGGTVGVVGVQNKCTGYNAAPLALVTPTSLATFNSGVTGVTASGGDGSTLFGVVDDTSALQTLALTNAYVRAGLSQGWLNGRVYKIDNSLSGTAAILRPTGNSGNLNKHSFQSYGRVTGSNAYIRMSTAGEGPKFFSTAHYSKVVSPNVTPAGTGSGLQMVAAPGSVAYFILFDLVESVASPAVPTVVAGAAATGAFPTYFSKAGAVGVDVIYYGRKIVNGIPKISVGIKGTASGNSIIQLYPDYTTNATASQGDFWAGAVHAETTYGVAPSFIYRLSEWNGGSYIRNLTGANSVLVDPKTTINQGFVTSGSSTNVRACVEWSVVNGVVYDCSILVSGPTLFIAPYTLGDEQVTNGGFDAGSTSGWQGSGASIANVSDTLEVTSTSGSYSGSRTILPTLESGVIYCVTSTIVSNPSGKGIQGILSNSGQSSSYGTFSTNGVPTFMVPTTLVSVYLYLRWNGNSVASDVYYSDNVSMRPVRFAAIPTDYMLPPVDTIAETTYSYSYGTKLGRGMLARITGQSNSLATIPNRSMARRITGNAQGSSSISRSLSKYIYASLLNGSSIRTITGRWLAAQVGRVYTNKIRNPRGLGGVVGTVGVQNKCTGYNAAPVNTSGFAIAGGDGTTTLTCVDGSAALAAAAITNPFIQAGLEQGWLNGNVFRLDNSASPTVAYAKPSGSTGNTSTHTFGSYMWGSGTGGTVLSGIGGSGIQTVALTGTPQRVTSSPVAAVNTSQGYIVANAGADVYFILFDLVQGSAPAPVPTVVAGASATGALPTNWSIEGGNTYGLSLSYYGQPVGTKDTARIRYNGTGASTNTAYIKFEPNNYADASPLQAWGLDSTLTLVDGSMSAATARHAILEYTGAGSYLRTTVPGTNMVPTSTPTRVLTSGVVYDPSAGKVNSFLGINLTSAVVYDFTLDITAPKLVNINTLSYEKIDDVDFDNSGAWSKHNASITVSAGAAHFSNTPDGKAIYKALPTPAGLVQRGVINVTSLTLGQVRPTVNGYSYLISTPGVYTFDLPTSGASTVGIYSVGTTTADVDFFSVTVTAPGYIPDFPILPPEGVIADSVGTYPAATLLVIRKLLRTINATGQGLASLPSRLSARVVSSTSALSAFMYRVVSKKIIAPALSALSMKRAAARPVVSTPLLTNAGITKFSKVGVALASSQVGAYLNQTYVWGLILETARSIISPGTVYTLPNESEARLTEDGDVRITEDGFVRVLESDTGLPIQKVVKATRATSTWVPATLSRRMTLAVTRLVSQVQGPARIIKSAIRYMPTATSWTWAIAGQNFFYNLSRGLPGVGTVAKATRKSVTQASITSAASTGRRTRKALTLSTYRGNSGTLQRLTKQTVQALVGSYSLVLRRVSGLVSATGQGASILGKATSYGVSLALANTLATIGRRNSRTVTTAYQNAPTLIRKTLRSLTSQANVLAVFGPWTTVRKLFATAMPLATVSRVSKRSLNTTVNALAIKTHISYFVRTLLGVGEFSVTYVTRQMGRRITSTPAKASATMYRMLGKYVTASGLSAATILRASIYTVYASGQGLATILRSNAYRLFGSVTVTAPSITRRAFRRLTATVSESLSLKRLAARTIRATELTSATLPYRGLLKWVSATGQVQSLVLRANKYRLYATEKTSATIARKGYRYLVSTGKALATVPRKTLKKINASVRGRSSMFNLLRKNLAAATTHSITLTRANSQRLVTGLVNAYASISQKSLFKMLSTGALTSTRVIRFWGYRIGTYIQVDPTLYRRFYRYFNVAGTGQSGLSKQTKRTLQVSTQALAFFGRLFLRSFVTLNFSTATILSPKRRLRRVVEYIVTTPPSLGKGVRTNLSVRTQAVPLLRKMGRKVLSAIGLSSGTVSTHELPTIGAHLSKTLAPATSIGTGAVSITTNFDQQTYGTVVLFSGVRVSVRGYLVQDLAPADLDAAVGVKWPDRSADLTATLTAVTLSALSEVLVSGTVNKHTVPATSVSLVTALASASIDLALKETLSWGWVTVPVVSEADVVTGDDYLTTVIKVQVAASFVRTTAKATSVAGSVASPRSYLDLALFNAALYATGSVISEDDITIELLDATSHSETGVFIQALSIVSLLDAGMYGAGAIRIESSTQIGLGDTTLSSAFTGGRNANLAVTLTHAEGQGEMHDPTVQDVRTWTRPAILEASAGSTIQAGVDVTLDPARLMLYATVDISIRVSVWTDDADSTSIINRSGLVQDIMTVPTTPIDLSRIPRDMHLTRLRIASTQWDASQNDTVSLQTYNGRILFVSEHKLSDMLQVLTPTGDSLLYESILPSVFSVAVVATDPLAAVYDNESYGVGASLTFSDAGDVVIDGHTLGMADFVLVTGQAYAQQNGLFKVTDVTGNVVLTRSTDFDTPAKVVKGTSVVATQGTANAGSAWALNPSCAGAVFGTDPITFYLVAGGANKGNSIVDQYGVVHTILFSTPCSNVYQETTNAIPKVLVPSFVYLPGTKVREILVAETLSDTAFLQSLIIS